MNDRLKQIDALVAENVMGWRLERIGKEHQCEYWYPSNVDRSCPPLSYGARPVELWNPTKNLPAAWEVTEKLQSPPWNFKVQLNGVRIANGLLSYVASFFDPKTQCQWYSPPINESAPLALCLAALSALGCELPP